MGNQVARAGHASSKKTYTVAQAGETANAASLSKSSSGTELESNSHMQFFPIESLAKVWGRSLINCRFIVLQFAWASHEHNEVR